MREKIKVTTGDLKNQAKALSDLSMRVSSLSARNNQLISRMENACSSFHVAGIYVSANILIDKFTKLMTNLNRGVSTALNCAAAYEETDSELKKLYENWFTDVSVGNGTWSFSTVPTDLEQWAVKTTDTEFALLTGFWTDASQKENPEKAFREMLEKGYDGRKLSDSDPLKDILNNPESSIKTVTRPNGFDAAVLTDGSGNAVVLFAGTNGDLGDIWADVNIALGMESEQEKQAKQLIDAVSKSNSNIVVAGYSLGGYLATSVTLNNPAVSRCIAIEPPGRYDTLFQNITNAGNVDKIAIYEANGSVVSAVGTGVGHYHKIDVEFNMAGPAPNHGIYQMYDAMGGDNALKNAWSSSL